MANALKTLCKLTACQRSSPLCARKAPRNATARPPCSVSVLSCRPRFQRDLLRVYRTHCPAAPDLPSTEEDRKHAQRSLRLCFAVTLADA
jgi:hypothetical protein